MNYAYYYCMEWVQIRTYSYPMQAQMDILLLEAAGIRYQLGDERTIQIDPLISNAIGGVKLWVAEEDAARATEILEENDERRKEAHPEEYLHPEEKKMANWIIWALLFAAVVFVITLAVSASSLE